MNPRRFVVGLIALLLLFEPRPSSAQQSPTAEQNPQSKHKKEKPEISPQEAQELFRHLDEVLDFVSDDTKLPIVHPVKKQLASKDDVEQSTEKRVNDDKDAQRLERGEVVLKKFGYVPRDFNLREYLVKLMREQVAGFYNTEDQTVYMMDWVPEEQQMPVMAHELTHALQDQQVHLKQWLRGDVEQESATDLPAARSEKKSEAEVAASDPPPNPADEIKQDEEEIARESLAEGQGMVVMIDYLLRGSGQNALTAPFIAQNLKASMADGGSYPVFKNAPLFLQESLSFPYSYGLDFVEQLLVKGGKQLAYRGALENPPVNSHEIMEPKAYLRGEKQPLMEIPDLKAAATGYEYYDAGSMGEFEVMVFLKQFSGNKTAEQMQSDWRGGAYWAYKAKAPAQGATAGPAETKSIALVYASRWATPQTAQRFAAEYAKALLKRYQFAKPEGNAGTEWATNEGPVLVEARGDVVLALESFDPKTMEAVRNSIWSFEQAHGEQLQSEATAVTAAH